MHLEYFYGHFIRLLKKGVFSASLQLLTCVTALLYSHGQATAQNSLGYLDIISEVQDK